MGIKQANYHTAGDPSPTVGALLGTEQHDCQSVCGIERLLLSVTLTTLCTRVFDAMITIEFLNCFLIAELLPKKAKPWIYLRSMA
jgi:hypothetical protein